MNRDSASLYVRLSKEAGTSNLSRDGMVEDLKALAHQHNFKVHAVHIDDGISGAIRDRPAFLAWLNDAKSGQVSNLLTWHADRLTREGVNAAGMILDVVEGKDPVTGKVIRDPVRLLDVKGTDSDGDETAFRFQFVIAAEIARAERARMSDRNTSQQRRLREGGRYRGGYVPYGYQVVPLDGGGKTLDILPMEAAILREAVQLVLEGKSLYSIVRALNETGVKPRKAEHWTMQSLKNMLIGDAILGRVSHKGVPVRGKDGLPLAPFPPLISLEESEQLRGILNSPARRNAGKQPRLRASRILSGMMICCHCKQNLRVNTTTERSGNKTVRYLCAGASQANCQKPVTVRARYLEPWIEEEFLTRYGHLDETREIYGMQEIVGLAEVELALRELSAQMIQPDADVAKIAEQITSLQEKRKGLAKHPQAPVKKTIKTGRSMAQAWEHGDLDARRELLAWALTDKITVYPGTRGVPGVQAERFNVPWREDDLPPVAVDEKGRRVRVDQSAREALERARS